MRDAWLAWPARIGPELAADLGLDATRVMIALEPYVRRQLQELADARPRPRRAPEVTRLEGRAWHYGESFANAATAFPRCQFLSSWIDLLQHPISDDRRPLSSGGDEFGQCHASLWLRAAPPPAGRSDPSYAAQKGKNLATKEDIEEITKKVEGVKAAYEAERQARENQAASSNR